ncbi:MAG: hypothetical protein K6T73_11130, partial [Candidatus Bathyarchaeota archaeon]|nr:hypothetical protein [Candidatus Bathyarchaeota archaeon]
MPVPSGYSWNGWVDKIAQAMLNHRVTWVHTAGYPFYRVWVQGESSSQEWGEGGFKQLMSHINKPDVTCWPSGNELAPVQLNGECKQQLLSGGYPGFNEAWWVQFGRPLKASDFKENLMMPIHGGGHYYTSAVIGFAKPGQTFNPNNRNGFGAYVHIGTYQTKDYWASDTEADYWRGYVGAAAAVWSEMKAFDARGMSRTFRGVDYAMYTKPSIKRYVLGSIVEVRICFPIYGRATAPAIGSYISYVTVETNKVPPGCDIQLKTYLSKSGSNTEGLVFTGLYQDEASLLIDSLLFFGSLPIFGTGVGTVIAAMTFAKLMADWATVNMRSTERGVNTPDD